MTPVYHVQVQLNFWCRVVNKWKLMSFSHDLNIWHYIWQLLSTRVTARTSLFQWNDHHSATLLFCNTVRCLMQQPGGVRDINCSERIKAPRLLPLQQIYLWFANWIIHKRCVFWSWLIAQVTVPCLSALLIEEVQRWIFWILFPYTDQSIKFQNVLFYSRMSTSF